MTTSRNGSHCSYRHRRRGRRTRSILLPYGAHPLRLHQTRYSKEGDQVVLHAALTILVTMSQSRLSLNHISRQSLALSRRCLPWRRDRQQRSYHLPRLRILTPLFPQTLASCQRRAFSSLVVSVSLTGTTSLYSVDSPPRQTWPGMVRACLFVCPDILCPDIEKRIDGVVEHTIFVAESPEQYDRDPWIARISPLLLPPQLIADDSPPLTPDLGRRPVSPPRRAQAVEPPYFEPNGRPSAYHDPPGYWFWPYEPNSYEREIYWEVYFRLLDELGDSPELPAVWPDGQRPLAPHWRPNGYVLR